jgi:hypothetical protein
MTMPPVDPMQPQGPPPPQPPVLPPLPNPFHDRPNDTEPAVALIYQKRLSKLFVDPKFEAMPPEWQNLPIALYQKVTMALQPPPVVPRGVSIVDKVSGGDIGAEEAAAASGKPAQAQQPARPPVPQRPIAAKVGQQGVAPPGQRAL